MKNWIKSGLVLVLALAILMPVSAKDAAAKEDAAAFYKGKLITFLVPYSPGGGYDTLARLISPFLEQYTGATVIVNNMIGAGGLLAANHLYNRAKRNGLTILLIAAPTLYLNKLLDRREAKFELTGFAWLVRPNWDRPVFWVSAASPYRSIADLRAAKEFKVGLPSKWGLDGFRTACTMEAFGLYNAKFIDGYPGKPELHLAMARREIDANVGSIESAIGVIESGDGIPLAAIDYDRDPLLPNVPTASEVGMVKKGEKWMKWWIGLQRIHRVILSTPKTPEARVAFLRDALMKTLRNKKFLDRAAKARRSVDPLSGEEAFKLLKESVLSKKEAEEIKYLTGKKYYK